MNDSRKKLYDALTTNGYKIGDFEKFDQAMNDPNRRKGFYDKVQATGKFNLGDFETFETKVSGVTPTQRDITRLTGNPVVGKMAGVAERAISNIPQSGAKFAGDIYDAVTSPVQTGKAVVRTIAGGLEKAIPGNQESEKYFDSLVNHFKQRYGSVEKLNETIASDPVGFASDLSTALTGGGAVLSGAGKASKVSSVSKAGKIAKDLAASTDPIAGPVNALKGFIPQSIPNKLYESSLKPSTTLAPEKYQKVIQTGLREGITPNKAGYDKLGDLISGINDEIAKRIDNAAQNKVRVNTADIARRIDDLKTLYGRDVLPTNYLDKIDEMKSEFMKYHGQQIPIDKAQQIKQATYKILNKNYGELKSVEIEGRKALVRGIKEEIAQKYPDINKLNAEEGALIELNDSIERAVNRINNRDVFSLGQRVMAGASGSPTAGFVMGLIDTPTLKSKIAIALNKAKKSGSTRKIPYAPIATFSASQQQEQR